MRPSTRIAVIRGAGLSFPLACLLFMFTGQPAVFGLMPLGALVGLGVGEVLARNPGQGQMTQAQRGIGPARPGWMEKHLLHASLPSRFIKLALFSALVFLLAWCIGYYLLPEGIFRRGAEARLAQAALDGHSASVFEEWVKIFSANLAPAVILLACSLLMRVNGAALGTLTALVNVVGYGLFLGSNSLAIAMPVRMAPSLAVFQRSGPYEILALILLAASAFGWSFFEVKRIFITNPERVVPRPKITLPEVIGVCLGLLLLAGANWVEAVMVMAVSQVQ